MLVPREDRQLVALRGADYSAVWKYGSWRGLQQTLRPAMFTITRLLVLTFAGLMAVGELEAARTYTSPLVLVVGGFSSFLFVRFAGKHRQGAGGSRREADLTVLLLLGLTVLMGAVAVVCLPWLGPLLFGVPLDTLAVVAWIAYGTSVAMVTPYGALSAVSGRQTAVFLIRLGDTILGLVAVALLLATGWMSSWVPFVLALASTAGGLGLRRLAASAKDSPSPDSDDPPVPE
jgi:O-antigen/teichoic acid export membrane protein